MGSSRRICSRAWSKRLRQFSDPEKAQRRAKEYLGSHAQLCVATNPDKKYRIQDPHTGKWTHFGQMGYEDFTRHHDLSRRRKYLTRSSRIKGSWRNNRYSANNLSRHILW